ncbi:MAG: hypothetical protein A2W99_14965 [Bacteroidetes bacterium GWF2_33_16]|nr:MAG: hypothetical protein A2X00_00120 [Bacteroidetes bacterium GWE2_32_14]OFY07628.1 MAG: hypothetical protein A2W99_14965 [Bacteroidetes bacterium GWF2_33_16]
MKKAIIFSFIIPAILFASCEKDDLTEPVSIDFEFSMDTFQLNEGGKQGLFEINKGTLIIQTLELDGRRDQGDDYFFSSSFVPPLKAELHTKTINQDVVYDIPQGIYNRIELNLSIGVENENALCFEGRFQRGPMDDMPVVFEYAFQEHVRIRAKNKVGDDQIVISKENPLKARVVFNVPNMFQFVNMNMIRNAATTEINGMQAIKINSQQNTDIFNLLAARLDNALYVVFE